MEKEDKQNIDFTFEQWQQLLNLIQDSENQLRFLRQYYNAFKIKNEFYFEEDEIKKFPAKATKSNVLKIYENFINKNAELILKELLEKGEIYSKLIGGNESSTDTITDKIEELNRVGASTSYTLLMYLLSKKDKLYDDKTFESVLDFIIKYYARRNVTDMPNTRDLDDINIEVIKKCEDDIARGEKITLDSIMIFHLDNTKAKHAELLKFKEFLSGKIYSENAGMTRYLLCKLGENQTKEIRNLWERDKKNKYVWTIEHIFPEGKNIPECWINSIANGNKEEAERIQQEYVHLIGNLTLSGYNSNLSNRSFEEKQNHTDKKGNKIGYQNGLSLNNLEFETENEKTNLAKIENWTKESIKSRTITMVEELLEIFKFKNEK